MTQPTAWRVEFNVDAAKELRKLGGRDQERILRYLRSRIVAPEDPRRFGKALGGDMAGLWRYRVGDFRIVCRIEDAKVVVFVVRLGHRREVYL